MMMQTSSERQQQQKVLRRLQAMQEKIVHQKATARARLASLPAAWRRLRHNPEPLSPTSQPRGKITPLHSLADDSSASDDSEKEQQPKKQGFHQGAFNKTAKKTDHKARIPGHSLTRRTSFESKNAAITAANTRRNSGSHYHPNTQGQRNHEMVLPQKMHHGLTPATMGRRNSGGHYSQVQQQQQQQNYEAIATQKTIASSPGLASTAMASGRNSNMNYSYRQAQQQRSAHIVPLKMPSSGATTTTTTTSTTTASPSTASPSTASPTATSGVASHADQLPQGHKNREVVALSQRMMLSGMTTVTALRGESTRSPIRSYSRDPNSKARGSASVVTNVSCETGDDGESFTTDHCWDDGTFVSGLSSNPDTHEPAHLKVKGAPFLLTAMKKNKNDFVCYTDESDQGESGDGEFGAVLRNDEFVSKQKDDDDHDEDGNTCYSDNYWDNDTLTSGGFSSNADAQLASKQKIKGAPFASSPIIDKNRKNFVPYPSVARGRIHREQLQEEEEDDDDDGEFGAVLRNDGFVTKQHAMFSIGWKQKPPSIGRHSSIG